MPFTKLQASLGKQLIKATKIIDIQTIMLSYLIERRESQACARYPEQGQLKNTIKHTNNTTKKRRRTANPKLQAMPLSTPWISKVKLKRHKGTPLAAAPR
jgi:hypothetical protein